MSRTSKTGLVSGINFLAKLPPEEAAVLFQRLEPARFSTPEETRQWIGKLFRGATLLKHALEWKHPTVGGGGKSDPLRGRQWRLVMAYSGYEQIENSIFAKNSKARVEFLAKIHLNHRLPGPVLSQRALDHIEERETAADELCDFLGIQKQKRGRFTQWLLGHVVEQECNNDRTLFIIAQLRHLVAHGALSADRANKLGLEPCFSVAPQVLHELTGALLQELIPNKIQIT